jgi:NAD(P)-dependent dehydrogenase (short-subunit alcohol dehydrogenase family)
MEKQTGKVMLITGATSGIGQETALELARLGSRVIVVGRSSDKCEATLVRIERETGSQETDGLLADLSNMSQVRGLARQVQEKYDRLDVLVNNAGGFFMRRSLTKEGFEKTFALNHLSYFLLTLLLLDMLKASAPARIVNVSSNSHYGQHLDFENLQGEKGYNPMKAYGRSKLANILFTYELARRLDGSSVTANALHPGFVATNIFSLNSPLLKKLAEPIMRRIALAPQEGAQTSIYLAASPEVEGVSGKFFVKKQVASSDPTSYDEKAARRLWEVSRRMVGL